MSTETKQAQIPDELRYYFLAEAEKLIDSSIGYDEKENSLMISMEYSTKSCYKPKN